ncbi:sulfatase [Rhodocytophaga rosea]|uniref:Sulfatase n=1 Tax=Rhodocytophaga rosea TaxID=2704465 RepID=A0A6C0GCA2_9BACT|nr:sulfatase [Rhodocytophaga rosea]QHT65585.1 sulfatase [Rhodocytophaga rosea]
MKFHKKRKDALFAALSLAVTLAVFLITAFTYKDKTPGKKSLPASIQAATKPNIVVILADDLGYTDLASYGNKIVQTPNIDALGKEGIRFTQAYSSAPICSPSRAGLLTGRYQQRFGFEFLVPQNTGQKPSPEQMQKLLAFQAKVGSSREPGIDEEAFNKIGKGLPESEISLAKLLKQNGYKTAIIGKWHVGETEGFYPQQRGFDYHYGFYSGLTLYSPESDPSVVDKHLPWALSESAAWHRNGSNRLVRNNQDVDEKQYLTDKFADEAIAYIEQNKTNPFFLYLPFNAPHDPFQAKQSDFDKYPNVSDSTKRVYYGMITGLDNAVGRIHQKLKDLGLDKNTIIVFTSDNGGATYTRGTDNAPLRGGKLSHFEGGYSVPYFIKYPGKITAGKEYTLPVSNLDIFPTVAAAAGVKLPTDREYDGVNLLPFLNNQKQGAPHETLYWRSGYSKAIRKGDYKLYINERNGKQLLFNLAKDRSETKDLCAEHPEKVKELLADLKTWESKLQTPTWPHRTNSTIEVNGEKYFFPI